MKKIMILGAGVYQLPILQKAAQMCNVVLVAPAVPEEYMKYADSVYYYDLREQEKILEAARKEQIDGIASDQTDIPVRTMAYVAQNMGLPGLDYETACLFTDKGKMHEKLVEIGVDVLPNQVVKTLEEAKKFFETLNGPAIMKPADNQGSRGVYKITTQEELERYFESSIKLSKVGEIVMEKFADGREFVVDALCYDYEYRELMLSDELFFDIENAFSAKERISPSIAEDKLKQKISALNEKIIRGFGLKQGLSHSEYIMDGDDVYLLETAARGGGVFISSDLLHLSTGLNTEEFLIQAALGDLKEVPKLEKEKCACGYMAFYLPKGIVKSAKGLQEVDQLDCVHRNILYTIRPGMEIGEIEDKTSRFTIIVSGETREELEQNMEKIKNMIDIEVETTEGIQYPIWD